MASRIVINTERCKGCGLCVKVCPKNGIVISEFSNKNGYFIAEARDGECTGCAVCAIICPEAVIEVYREERIIAIEAKTKRKSTPVEEKA